MRKTIVISKHRAGLSLTGPARCLLKFLAITLGLILGFGPAEAHLLPAQTATMNVVGNTAYFVVSVPASALTGLDDDHSGGVSAAEIARHSQDISLQFNRRFRISAEGQSGVTLMTMAWSPQTEGLPSDSRYIVVLHSVQFDVPPKRPSIKTDLFGTGPGEGQMTMTDKRDKREDTAEVAILRPGASEHRFFKNGLGIFGDFLRLGVEHILTGPDHLLFLLTILVGAAGVRYWVSVVTSFTIAHSITLTLAALKLVDVSPSITEPAIAASIVLMACLNLWRDGLGFKTPTRIVIVFGCGLLHGLGFASALGMLTANGSHRLASLAGFNLGIELVQLIFLGGLVLIFAQMRHILRPPLSLPIPRLASLIAAVLGGVMLISRVLPLVVPASSH